MIVKTYLINGMHCKGCVKKVQQAFISHNQISEANVNLEKSSVKLKMIKMLQFDELTSIIKNIGDYQLIENECEIFFKKNQISTYKPLYTYSVYFTFILSAYKTSFHFMNWMSNFMGGFFITFSFFKFLDLNGFSNSFDHMISLQKNGKTKSIHL